MPRKNPRPKARHERNRLKAKMLEKAQAKKRKGRTVATASGAATSAALLALLASRGRL